jgi:hypothetical protein
MARPHPLLFWAIVVILFVVIPFQFVYFSIFFSFIWGLLVGIGAGIIYKELWPRKDHS